MSFLMYPIVGKIIQRVLIKEMFDKGEKGLLWGCDAMEKHIEKKMAKEAVAAQQQAEMERQAAQMVEQAMMEEEAGMPISPTSPVSPGGGPMYPPGVAPSSPGDALVYSLAGVQISSGRAPTSPGGTPMYPPGGAPTSPGGTPTSPGWAPTSPGTGAMPVPDEVAAPIQRSFEKEMAPAMKERIRKAILPDMTRDEAMLAAIRAIREFLKSPEYKKFQKRACKDLASAMKTYAKKGAIKAAKTAYKAAKSK